MARQSDGQGTGLGRAGDQTAMPGQVPDEIFGISIGSGNHTGAPGSTGATGQADDTNMPGQVTERISGVTETGTGAPGSAGAQAHVATGAAWTSPFGVLDGGGMATHDNGSVDTEGHSNKYGTNTMAGVSGPGQPKGTGAGSGSVLHGGRRVR